MKKCLLERSCERRDKLSKEEGEEHLNEEMKAEAL